MNFLNKAYDLYIQASDGSCFQSYGTDWEDVYSNTERLSQKHDDRFQTHPCGGVSEEFIYWYENDWGLDEISYYRVLIGPDPVDSNLQARQEEFKQQLAGVLPF